jgi:hypothetical protein
VLLCSPDALQEFSNHRVSRVDLATGATTTLAGSGAAGFRDGDGSSAQFKNPSDVAIDPGGTFALVMVRASPANGFNPHTRPHSRAAGDHRHTASLV